MKKKYFILFAIFAIVLLIGCGNLTQVQATAELPHENFMRKIDECDNLDHIEEWKDTETGVHYFIYNRTSSYGYAGAGGICPRYNADGTLYVD